METEQPKKKVGMGYLIVPLFIYFAVTFLVEILYGVYLMVRVTMGYIAESPAFEGLLESLGNNYSFSELTAKVNEVMTTDVSNELMNLTMTQLQENLTMLTVLGALAAIPVFIIIFKRDQKKYAIDATVVRVKEKIWKYVLILGVSVVVCVGLNNLLTLSNLAQISESYQQVSESLYSASFLLQVIGLGIIVPIAEEMVFRGVLYNRLRYVMKYRSAMIWSALIFGMYHGNVVQMIYATLCAVLFVWLYERYGSIKAPIMAHICMNLTSLILTRYETFMWIFKDPMRVGIITVVCAAVGSTLLVLTQNITKKKVA